VTTDWRPLFKASPHLRGLRLSANGDDDPRNSTFENLALVDLDPRMLMRVMAGLYEIDGHCP